MSNASNFLRGFSLSALVLLAGCASGGSAGSADPRLTSGDTAKFFSKSGFQACAGGAAVGVLGCALSNSGDKAVCAIAAGLLACGVAMGANYYYDDRRAKYSNTTQRLEVMTADVKADSARVAQRTEVLQSIIADDKQKIAQLDRDLKANKIKQSDAKSQLGSIDKNISLMKKDIANMENKATEYRNTAKLERENGVSAAEIASVDKEIQVLEQQVARLNVEVNELYTQRNAISHG